MTTLSPSTDIWKFYGDYAALRDISLNIESGSCTALLGRNGAGKTTLLQTIAGSLAQPKAALPSMATMSARNSTRHRLGVLGHSIGIYDELSARESAAVRPSLRSEGRGESRDANGSSEWGSRG